MTATQRTFVPIALLGIVLGADAALAQVTGNAPIPYPSAPAVGVAVPYGYPAYPQRGYGAALQGAASLTAASGQYQTDIQQAKIMREKSRQESLVTQRKQIDFEMQYEDLRRARIRADRDYEQAAILDRARRFPSDDDIWSGRSLNVLLKSVMMSTSSARGPNVGLSQATLLGLNLTATGSTGNLGLAKDEGKVYWSDALMEAPFDDARKRFDANFPNALKYAQAGERPDRALLMDLNKDFKSLSDTLNDRVGDLSAGEYIASTRVLNQLKVALQGLSDPRVVRSSNVAWKKKVRTVADIVAYCKENGLEFTAAAALGDRGCYEAAYYAVRSYERDVSQLASAK